MAKPMRALVMACLPCWAFLGSPPPVPIIRLIPPKIKRNKRIMPAITRALLKIREMKVARLGKV